jgi:hypothetical protein
MRTSTEWKQRMCGVSPMTVGTDISFAIAALLDDFAAVENELKTYREGGVTEEILRRNDQAQARWTDGLSKPKIL